MNVQVNDVYMCTSFQAPFGRCQTLSTSMSWHGHDLEGGGERWGLVGRNDSVVVHTVSEIRHAQTLTTRLTLSLTLWGFLAGLQFELEEYSLEVVNLQVSCHSCGVCLKYVSFYIEGLLL